MVRHSRIVTPILIATFFILTLCSAGLVMAHSHADMHASACPFTASIQLSHFATILSATQTDIALAVLLLAFAVTFGYILNTSPLVRPIARLSLLRAYPPTFSPPLQFAFSQGILNPKAY